MKFSRIVAAVCTATSLLAPSAHAQDDGQMGAPVSVNSQMPVKVIEATVTGYASGGGDGISDMTASGIHTHWGTVAADWRLYPVGTRLQIEGFPNDVFTVEDTGGGVHGNIFDVWFPDLPTAVGFGTRTLRVTVLSN